MGFGVGAGFEHLGAEFVAHEDVLAQIDIHATGASPPPARSSQHVGAVRSEMQVGAADSTRSHRDQHLAGSGTGSGKSSR